MIARSVNRLDGLDRRELDFDGVLESGEVGLNGIEVHAERAVAGRDITHAARRPCADSRGQQDRPFVDDRIDRRLELDEQHRIAAVANLHCAQRVQQLPVNAAEAAVRHDDDQDRRRGPRRPRLRQSRRRSAGVAPRTFCRARSSTSRLSDRRSSGGRLDRKTDASTTSSAPANARAKSSWNTRRHDDAERGSKIAHTRRPGAALTNRAQGLVHRGGMVREVVVDGDAASPRRPLRAGASRP